MLEQPLWMLHRELSRDWIDRDVSQSSETLPYEIPFREPALKRHVGIEIEVENCGPDDYRTIPWWSVERDGSLRGESAREFKTKFPCTCYDGLQALAQFFTMVQKKRSVLGDDLFDFSERTSIHVHVDVRDLTELEIKSATKLYMIFERSFFDLVGRHRRHNIFCVPLSESNLLEARAIGKWYNKWDKYCALNLAPLRTFGTMEFRAMAGNDDHKLIASWLVLLTCLAEFAAQHSPDVVDTIIMTLKTESQYMMLAKQIFGDHLASLLTIFPEASDSAASLTKLL